MESQGSQDFPSEEIGFDASNFPPKWPDNFNEILRPRSREIQLSATGEPYNLEEAIKLEKLMTHYSEQMHKLIKQIRGDATFKMEEAWSIYGIADGLATEINFPMKGRLGPITLEAFSIINPQMFQDLSNRNIVVIGDSTDAILLANLLHAQMSEVSIEWLVMREYLGHEATKRNYAFHEELAYALEPDKVLSVNPTDQHISSTLCRIRLCFPRGAHVLFLNATGSEVLEDNASLDSYETVNRALSWLEIGETVCKHIMRSGGNMTIRLNLLVLTRGDTFLAVCQLVKLFRVAKLIAPVLGVDSGIIYLILEDYQDIHLERNLNLIDKNKDNPFLKPEIYGALRQIVPFLQESVTCFTFFMDSLIGMLNMDNKSMEVMAQELKTLRDQDTSYKPTSIDALKEVMMAFFTEHEGKLSSIKRRETPSGGHVDIFCMLKKAKDDWKAGLESVLDFRKSSQEQWDDGSPQFIKLDRTLMWDYWIESFEEDHDQEFDVIWGSRWCLSSLVLLRGVFKTILMDNQRRLNYQQPEPNCPLCKIWTKRDMLNILKDKLRGGLNPSEDISMIRRYIVDKKSFVKDCFLEDFKSFASKSDLECAYGRAGRMMEILENLPDYGSIFICSYPLLTRFDVGVVLLLTSLFSNVFVVGCNQKQSVFGLFFHDLLTVGNPEGIKTKVVIRNVRRAIAFGLSEVADFCDLDAFFDSCFYLEQYNSHVVDHGMQMQEQRYLAAMHKSEGGHGRGQ